MTTKTETALTSKGSPAFTIRDAGPADEVGVGWRTGLVSYGDGQGPTIWYSDGHTVYFPPWPRNDVRADQQSVETLVRRVAQRELGLTTYHEDPQ
ncbi:hypothetical protein LCGC14_0898510 [marine sediment metagenome]|uniref:Uncharacterized protein n=1 Tax=marine sediment metagenome TaxID=412755 RepID=A0A0F9NX24_9ZZZZ